jgi:plasmid stability protein
MRMATISVRDLDDNVRDRLRVRAARHGRSMEAEIRDDLPIPPRVSPARAADFSP